MSHPTKISILFNSVFWSEQYPGFEFKHAYISTILLLPSTFQQLTFYHNNQLLFWLSNDMLIFRILNTSSRYHCPLVFCECRPACTHHARSGVPSHCEVLCDWRRHQILAGLSTWNIKAGRMIKKQNKSSDGSHLNNCHLISYITQTYSLTNTCLH